jgi:hypothetical protein
MGRESSAGIVREKIAKGNIAGLKVFGKTVDIGG